MASWIELNQIFSASYSARIRVADLALTNFFILYWLWLVQVATSTNAANLQSTIEVLTKHNPSYYFWTNVENIILKNEITVSKWVNFFIIYFLS